MTTMLTWQAEGRPGLEGTRVHFGPDPVGFRALGRIVRPDPAGDFTASYSLVVREDGTLGRLSLSAATTGFEKHLTMNRTDDGFWLLDDGSGSARQDFDGAVDVDLAFSPLFTSLPVRRLGVHRESVAVEVPVVFVSLPDLEVSLSTQRYRTVRAGEGNSPAVVEFSRADLRVELEVDADGFVLSVPGLAALVSNERAEPAGQS
ncbi:putative glycolipid-binding domain-containing protein [Pseudonocardia sp. RS11V-5]|uniref:putative glycolipid-binding domain-containing protein n=1 Tax=Pseudonocardia terrae TaxID=2905831 RepID=UPI001E5ABE1A|nr:putative glycolipid-binding domain-containing protein [Pseudonocardia terrae]MCE3550483.1 putative glycolipid-binding domain-containing protein [Pseudonocardia terrae]